MKEIWKKVKEFPEYEVSNTGKVRSWKTVSKYGAPCMLKPGTDKNGYLYVVLRKNGKANNMLVHRLVAIAFIDNKNNKPVVNHIDGNKKNNCVNNLEWCTVKENNIHAWKTGLQKPHGPEKPIRIIETGEIFKSLTDCAKHINGNPACINLCCNGKRQHHRGYTFEMVGDINLYPEQLKAIDKMHNGCCLMGGVGSGKSISSLYYYFVKVCGGSLNPFKFMKHEMDLYIITTAKKRDSNEWEHELANFRLTTSDNYRGVKVTIDSWNNIGKYKDVKNAFFIFDEQRLVSLGSWSKAFINIAKHNKWILLSATPGDTWSDYLSLFIANGFIKNKSEFHNRYCVFKRFSKFPQIERYLEEERLEKMRRMIIVPMKGGSTAEKSHVNINCDYNRLLYKTVQKSRINPETQEPCTNANELCLCLRKIVNTTYSKIEALNNIYKEHKKCIIFYNYNYELDILRSWCESINVPYAEWNGHKHQSIPKNDSWIYICQYSSANEGWNCIETDTIIFFSNNYSYKVMTQAAGRIDRMNTPFEILHYYHLITKSSIDRAIMDAIKMKQNFNERIFAKF